MQARSKAHTEFISSNLPPENACNGCTRQEIGICDSGAQTGDVSEPPHVPANTAYVETVSVKACTACRQATVAEGHAGVL